MAGLVDDATLARIDAEAARPFTWQVGSDPAVADLVADRFGDQVVTLARIDAEAARPFTWQVGSDPAVADLVADRFGESGPGPSRGYGPLRGRLANHAFGRETLQGVCAVQRSESCDRNPTFGDDDLATGPSSIEPIAEVRAQLGHGYIHTLNCTLTEP